MSDVAGVLKVPVDAIKNLNDEAAINYIITFNDNSKGDFNHHCTFNPMEKMVELYEALLKSEREKIALLEKMLERK